MFYTFESLNADAFVIIQDISAIVPNYRNKKNDSGKDVYLSADIILKNGKEIPCVKSAKWLYDDIRHL